MYSKVVLKKRSVTPEDCWPESGEVLETLRLVAMTILAAGQLVKSTGWADTVRERERRHLIKSQLSQAARRYDGRH